MQIVDGHAVLPRPRGSRSTYGDMIAVDLSGDCGAARTSLTFRYKANHEPENFTRTIDVALPAPGAITRMFVPTFESGAARIDDRLAFGAIEVPAADITCVTRLGRFANPDRHALLLPAVLTGDWAQEPLHQRLIRWEKAATIDTVRAVSYWSPPELRGAQLAITSGGAAGYQWPVDYNAKNAVASGDTVVVSGLADASGSYLVAWRPRPLAAGSVVQIEGHLQRGGFTLGFVDDSGWRASVDIDRAGAFTAAVQLPSAGRYQLVVANHLREGARANRFTISRIALVSGGS